jgi:hypothetical protein
MMMSQPSSGISSTKAREILHDGTVHGHPLTDAQRGMFGAAAGRVDHDHPGGPASLKAEEGLPPPFPGHPEEGLDPAAEHHHRQMDMYVKKYFPHLATMHQNYAGLFHHPMHHEG